MNLVIFFIQLSYTIAYCKDDFRFTLNKFAKCYGGTSFTGNNNNFVSFINQDGCADVFLKGWLLLSLSLSLRTQGI